VAGLGHVERMRSAVLLWTLTLVLIAVGLAASTALLVDYTKLNAVFCADGGGCAALRHSSYGHPFGVPLPIPGLVGFVLMGALTLGRGLRVRQVNRVVATGAGVIGLGLISLQLTLGHVCAYCMAVDGSALVLMVLSWNRLRRAWDPPEGNAVPRVAAVALALAVGGPLTWGKLYKAPVPAVIREELARTPKGKVPVVDFVDFECPFCRMAQEKLAPLLAARKDQVWVVRKLVPLTSIHPHALAAAKAACCAEALGKGDAMADALFTADIDELTPEGCAHIAESLGLPADKYSACVVDPATDERIARDRRDFNSAKSKDDGLPLMWIGSEKVMGARTDDTFERVLNEAASRAGS